MGNACCNKCRYFDLTDARKMTGVCLYHLSPYVTAEYSCDSYLGKFAPISYENGMLVVDKEKEE